jgi:hypothetical protein
MYAYRSLTSVVLVLFTNHQQMWSSSTNSASYPSSSKYADRSMTPMERWLAESTREAPFNAVASYMQMPQGAENFGKNVTGNGVDNWSIKATVGSRNR